MNKEKDNTMLDMSLLLLLSFFPVLSPFSSFTQLPPHMSVFLPVKW